MIELTVLIRRKPGLTKAEFQQYYEQNHAPLATRIFSATFREYRRSYVMRSIGVSTATGGIYESEDGPYDAVTRFTFDDQSAVDEFLRIGSDPAISSIIREDESKFIDQSSICLLFANVP